MSKASRRQQAERIQAARAGIGEGGTTAEVVQQLSARFGISRRQAYRYVEQARAPQQVVVLERKTAFTVKLPERLIQRLRRYAKSSGRSLSEIATRALEAFLSKR